MSIYSESLLGLRKEDAIEKVIHEKQKYRIIQEDEDVFFVTQDVIASRFNFVIKEGIVTQVKMG